MGNWVTIYNLDEVKEWHQTSLMGRGVLNYPPNLVPSKERWCVRHLAAASLAGAQDAVLDGPTHSTS